jgi:hypothetical protein
MSAKLIAAPARPIGLCLDVAVRHCFKVPPSSGPEA